MLFSVSERNSNLTPNDFKQIQKTLNLHPFFLLSPETAKTPDLFGILFIGLDDNDLFTKFQ